MTISSTLCASFDGTCVGYGDELAVLTAPDDEGVGLAEIEFSSRAIAAQLYHRHGVRAGDVVAVTLGDGGIAGGGAEIAAMVGCARLRAPFLPLDGGWLHKGERARQIVENAAPVAAIVAAGRSATADSDSTVRALSALGVHRHVLIEGEVIDAGAPLLLEAADVALDVPPAPDGISSLYLMYTSGSTGKPKGVLATERGLLNRIAWQWKQFPWAAGERVLRRTPLVFVDAIAEIFSAVLAAVPLVLAPQAAAERGMPGIIAHAAACRATRITLLPSQLTLALRAAEASNGGLARAWPSLTLVTVSGEPVPPALVSAFARGAPHGTLLNLYGSTEVAGDATSVVLHPNAVLAKAIAEDPRLPVPVGFPIDNTTVHLVEQSPTGSLTLVKAVGVAGELCVAGDGVALGYRDANGDDRFIPNPFRVAGESDAPARCATLLFRTGDLAMRRAEDGALVLLGRIDNQFKLRGVRVSLEEVEQAISSEFRAQGAVAVVCTPLVRATDAEATPRAANQLVAFVERREEECRSSHTLREALARALPPPHVPSILLQIERLPRTPTGKLDRSALLEMLWEVLDSRPVTPSVGDAIPSASAATDPAAFLRSLFAEVLPPQIDAPGEDEADDFFARRGGNSAMSIEVLWKIRAALGVELRPEALRLPLVDLARRLSDALELPVASRTSAKRSAEDLAAREPERSLRVRQSPSKEDALVAVNWISRTGHRLKPLSNDSPVLDATRAWAWRESWQHRMMKCVDASPLLLQFDDGSTAAFIGSHGGDFVSLAASTGDLRWRTRLPGHIEGAASCVLLGPAEPPCVVVGSYSANDRDADLPPAEVCGSGTVTCIAALTGATRWTFSQGIKEVKGAPLVRAGRVFVGTYGGLVVLDAKSGTMCASSARTGAIFASPVWCEPSGVVVVAATSGRVSGLGYCDDVLEHRWTYEVGAPVFATPCCCGDSVVFGAVDGALRCLSGGTLLWSQRSSARPIFSSACAATHGESIIFGAHDGRLRCAALSDGAELWSTDLGALVFSSPFAEKSLVVAANTAGELFALDCASGHVLARAQPFQGELYSSPTIFASTEGATVALLGCRDETIRAIRLDRA